MSYFPDRNAPREGFRQTGGFGAQGAAAGGFGAQGAAAGGFGVQGVRGPTDVVMGGNNTRQATFQGRTVTLILVGNVEQQFRNLLVGGVTETLLLNALAAVAIFEVVTPNYEITAQTLNRLTQVINSQVSARTTQRDAMENIYRTPDRYLTRPMGGFGGGAREQVRDTVMGSNAPVFGGGREQVRDATMGRQNPTNRQFY